MVWSHRLRQLAVPFFEVVVVVPRLSAAAPDLHEAHAALQQPPRDEQLPAVHAGAVHLAHGLRLAVESKASAASVCIR